ncbi:uncharacterized protein LOC103839844 isoform X2 [Brassica rapa]|uniref:uncharacterized protein LOC103839844 isoform X2 n=1 Tax=Brassica campestris TaxID=3711 RepID=UPI000872F171|nr:uncharacterized protein LOC103839844 isoform X2 [Brassica rapa]
MQTFATLSPIPEFMQWFLANNSHLTSRFGEDEGGGTQSNSTSFSENVLLPEEEQTLMSPSDDSSSGSNAMEALLNFYHKRTAIGLLHLVYFLFKNLFLCSFVLGTSCRRRRAEKL